MENLSIILEKKIFFRRKEVAKDRRQRNKNDLLSKEGKKKLDY